MYPLVKKGILSADYPACAFAMSGYSGGGKKMIAEYEAEERAAELSAPREYALSQQHKHLKEMKAVPGLDREPLFSPIVCDYYSGMLVSLPIQKDLCKKHLHRKNYRRFLQDIMQMNRLSRSMPSVPKRKAGDFYPPMSEAAGTAWKFL